MGLVLAVILGALALIVLGWTAIRSAGPAPARAVPEAVTQRARSAVPNVPPRTPDQLLRF
jgi:hypothetical protein